MYRMNTIMLNFSFKAQVVLQGKSRAAIVRELQRTVSVIYFKHTEHLQKFKLRV